MESMKNTKKGNSYFKKVEGEGPVIYPTFFNMGRYNLLLQREQEEEIKKYRRNTFIVVGIIFPLALISVVTILYFMLTKFTGWYIN